MKVFNTEYVGEPLINTFITYLDVKNFYLIQFIDSRFQVNNINPIETQVFEEYKGKPHNALVTTISFATIIKHREMKTISDGK